MVRTVISAIVVDLFSTTTSDALISMYIKISHSLWMLVSNLT